jgi:hypothetical protein
LSEAFIANPTTVLMAYMRGNQIKASFAHGQLAVGLEVVSLIRTLESIPVVSEQEKEGTIATLHTLLREQGLEGAYEAYDALADWRKVRFVPEPSLRANADASALLRVGRTSSSSAPGARDRTTALGGRLRALPGGRRNQEQGSSPTPEQLELPFGEE